MLNIFFNIISLVIVFSIRTKKVFFKSKVPSNRLIYSCLLIIGITFYLPFSFLQNIFSFQNIDLVSIETIILTSIVYFIVLDFAKIKYYKYIYKN